MGAIERPLYRLIASRIEARIASGDYSPGTALPPEPALEREFGVSRITVRQALGLLKRRGLLYSRSGVGTLVRPDAASSNLVRMTGSLSDLIAYGAETSYAPVDRRVVVPPAAVARMLGLPARGARVVCFRGVRSRPGAPRFGFEEVYIPEPLGRALDNRRAGWPTLFRLLEEAHGFEVVEARQIITAVPAPAAVGRHLRVRPRCPTLRVTRIYRASNGQTVEVAVTHYNASKFEYVMTLYRE